jgi:hypothetical protein
MRALPLSIGTIHFAGIARRGAAWSLRRAAAQGGSR